MAALRAAGLRVSAHKVGPDYIDPSYHAAATGLPGRNLDPWLVGEDLIAPLFLHGARGADIAIIEGVMGLFDGAAGRGDFASTAHVARLLDAPIVLVVSASRRGPVDRRHRARFRHLRSRACGSPGSCSTRCLPPGTSRSCGRRSPTLGDPGARRAAAEASLRTPSRHLGLVPAAERPAQVRDWLPPLRELVPRHLDLERLTAHRPVRAADLTALPWSAAGSRWRPRPLAGADGARAAGARPVRVAVAAGPGLHLRLRRARRAAGGGGGRGDGVRPDHGGDAARTGRTRWWSGGGFPELYAADLSANVGAAGRGPRPRRRRHAGRRRVRGPALARRANWTGSRSAACCRAAPG